MDDKVFYWARYSAIDCDGNQYEYSEKPIFNRENGEWEQQGGRCVQIRSGTPCTLKNAARSLVEFK